MADLTELQSAGNTKITGAGSTGIETNYLAVDSNQSAQVTLRDPTSGTGVTTTTVSAKQALDVNIASGTSTSQTATSRVTKPADVADTVATSIATLPNTIQSVADAKHMYALWGKYWSATTDLVTPGSTAETPLFLLKNPAASGKILKLSQLYLSPVGGTNQTTYKIYLNPTITANGTSVTAQGRRQTGQATLSTALFRSPTISVNGTLLEMHRFAAGSSEEIIDYDFSLFLDQ